MPDRFLRAAVGFALPPAGTYGAGVVFLPTNHSARLALRRLIERIITQEGQAVLGWRPVPVENAHLGPSAISSCPTMEQVFIGASDAVCRSLERDPIAFERRLYIIRRRIENTVDALPEAERQQFYIPSLS